MKRASGNFLLVWYEFRQKLSLYCGEILEKYNVIQRIRISYMTWTCKKCVIHATTDYIRWTLFIICVITMPCMKVVCFHSFAYGLGKGGGCTIWMHQIVQKRLIETCKFVSIFPMLLKIFDLPHRTATLIPFPQKFAHFILSIWKNCFNLLLESFRYELLRITTRIKDLREVQQKHVSRPSFNDEKSHEENVIEESTAEITKMLTHCHKLGIIYNLLIDTAYVTNSNIVI